MVSTRTHLVITILIYHVTRIELSIEGGKGPYCFKMMETVIPERLNLYIQTFPYLHESPDVRLGYVPNLLAPMGFELNFRVTVFMIILVTDD